MSRGVLVRGGESEFSVRKERGAAVNGACRQEKSSFCVIEGNSVRVAGIPPRLPGDSRVALHSHSATLSRRATVRERRAKFAGAPSNRFQNPEAPVYTSSARLFCKGARVESSRWKPIICLLRRIKRPRARGPVGGERRTSNLSAVLAARAADRTCVYGAVIGNTWRPGAALLAWWWNRALTAPFSIGRCSLCHTGAHNLHMHDDSLSFFFFFFNSLNWRAFTRRAGTLLQSLRAEKYSQISRKKEEKKKKRGAANVCTVRLGVSQCNDIFLVRESCQITWIGLDCFFYL